MSSVDLQLDRHAQQDFEMSEVVDISPVGDLTIHDDHIHDGSFVDTLLQNIRSR